MCLLILSPQWSCYSRFNTEGHTLVIDDDGDFAIAQTAEDGQLIASTIKYDGRSAPNGSPKNLIPYMKKNCTQEICSERQERDFLVRSSPECQDNDHTDCEIVVRRKLKESRRRRTATSTTGTVKNLVIPFKFSDHATRTLPTRNDLDLLFNGNEQDCLNTAICGNSGSVNTFYSIDSYGNLDLDSVVVDWVQINVTESQAAGGTSG